MISVILAIALCVFFFLRLYIIAKKLTECSRPLDCMETDRPDMDIRYVSGGASLEDPPPFRASGKYCCRCLPLDEQY